MSKLNCISDCDNSNDGLLTREEAIEILKTSDDRLDELIARAERLRRKYKGSRVSIHVLTNVRSGNCSQDCAYCAQSCRSKADIEKYKWVSDEKLYGDNDLGNQNHLSRHCIGLSGISFSDSEIEALAEKIKAMKATGTHLCCSIGFLLSIKGTPFEKNDISYLTTAYCMKVLCLARLLVPKADIRCAAGREVYFKGEEKKLLSVVDSVFASGYLTEQGQGIEDTIRTITEAGFTYEIEGQ